jgi:hypothetical protein
MLCATSEFLPALACRTRTGDPGWSLQLQAGLMNSVTDGIAGIVCVEKHAACVEKRIVLHRVHITFAASTVCSAWPGLHEPAASCTLAGFQLEVMSLLEVYV